MLVAGVAWGLYSLRGRGQGDAVATNAASFARALPLSIAAWAAAALLGVTRLDPTGARLALASGAVASGLGYAVWYAALRGLSATPAAIVQLSAAPLAAAGAVVFLGESFSPRLRTASVLPIVLSICGRAGACASAAARAIGARER